MNKLNWLFTFSSLSVVLVTIERFSPTTKILLQPYNFLRLHEVVQMSVLITLTVLIPFFVVREITNNFETIRERRGFWLFLLFVLGIYFYATGNGLHEVSSFNLNNYCDAKNIVGELCNAFFFNDYYTGNIYYFIGGTMMVVAGLLLEKLQPRFKFNNRELAISILNAAIYALAIFAYAAFDVVLVGLIYSVILMIVSLALFISIRKNYRKYPLITYTTITYSLGTIAALLVRFH
ncbi:hypothetical protein HY045_03320 [Candidatus Woesebacteria bacterium]|nr:hypothetical protein [Candidatus Woesebacteria bacterium]